MNSSPPNSPGRRALLRGRLQAPAPLRPPWAQNEAAFLECCSRCQACVSTCPEHLLHRGDGGFPEFVPRVGECTFCGECVRACPTAALDFSLGRRNNHRAQVGATCLGHSGIVCRSCLDVCPEQALALSSQALTGRGAAVPVLTGDQCSGCGACVAVCPVSAVSLHALVEAST